MDRTETNTTIADDLLSAGENTYEEKKQVLEEEYSIPMCNLSKGVENRGIQKGLQQGLQQGILKSIQNLMENTGWSIAKAMDLLNIPETDREVYLNMLHSQEAQ